MAVGVERFLAGEMIFVMRWQDRAVSVSSVSAAPLQAGPGEVQQADVLHPPRPRGLRPRERDQVPGGEDGDGLLRLQGVRLWAGQEVRHKYQYYHGLFSQNFGFSKR